MGHWNCCSPNAIKGALSEQISVLITTKLIQTYIDPDTTRGQDFMYDTEIIDDVLSLRYHETNWIIKPTFH